MQPICDAWTSDASIGLSETAQSKNAIYSIIFRCVVSIENQCIEVTCATILV